MKQHETTPPLPLPSHRSTLIVTEECLMDPSRNSHLSREDKENLLKEYLGIDKVRADGRAPTFVQGTACARWRHLGASTHRMARCACALLGGRPPNFHLGAARRAG